MLKSFSHSHNVKFFFFKISHVFSMAYNFYGKKHIKFFKNFFFQKKNFFYFSLHRTLFRLISLQYCIFFIIALCAATSFIREWVSLKTFQWYMNFYIQQIYIHLMYVFMHSFIYFIYVFLRQSSHRPLS
jgi:hypothetical protein